MADFNIYDSWGNFVGTASPSADAGMMGCAISIGILLIGFVFWLIYALFRLLINLVAKGIRALRDRKWLVGIGYLILPTTLVVLLFYFLGSIAEPVPAYYPSSSNSSSSSYSPSSYSAPSSSKETSQTGCGDNLPSRLSIGMKVAVEDTTGLCNRIRSDPDASYNNVEACEEPNTKLEIIDGPHCDKYLYWKVKILDGPDSGQIGWTAEGDSTMYWLIPIQ